MKLMIYYSYLSADKQLYMPEQTTKTLNQLHSMFEDSTTPITDIVVDPSLSDLMNLLDIAKNVLSSLNQSEVGAIYSYQLRIEYLEKDIQNLIKN